MISSNLRWPEGLASNTVCFSVDVEWAAAEVIADISLLFDSHGVTATFFVTHNGVAVPGHERGIHPNFLRGGDVYRSFPDAEPANDASIYEHIVASTLSFAPEAKGVRAHRLFYDSGLLPLYRRLGLEYDSSYHLAFVPHLRPFWKHDDIVEIPSFYGDHLDVTAAVTGFEITSLGLDMPGLKVFNFHPNIVYQNCPNAAAYAATKSFYHEPERLLASRHPGRGPRTLLIDLLAHIRRHNIPSATLGEVNEAMRRGHN